ncbi:DUF2333 family protein [Cocleimonas sp. KMM 6892]|uniref:DUF2333 family protein n=1 Tax=unclassified Cocleimonas TaxID=2639732 RepID=UPI002DBB0477|nr:MULTISPECIES: DUF2333 family protein [unclassified Cocleimonas]MEB8431483.1 DUF2333 family protein [Cocleimonas sp. KMM 6892]MEC4713745.1 DUF2333 family protein [Cocleimonas sp. KMM 6895]MEC4743076.1 DUF2333 family protein [Cocleimonas sp. KMM 6896]
MGAVGKVFSLYKPSTWKEKGLKWTIGMFIVTLLILSFLLMFYWSREPARFDVNTNAQNYADEMGAEMVTGFTTTATLSQLMKTLLDKPGGFLENDRMPPGVFMDNMPNWEFGVLVQARDLALALRNDLSRSQSQSQEDDDLINTATKFHTDTNLWILPPAESQYRDGIKTLDKYLARLSSTGKNNAQFYARADNLGDWVDLVKKRLGSLAQELSSSVGREQLDTSLAGDKNAKQSTPNAESNYVKTGWFKIDDVFYEARGQTYALIHILRAIEVDFNDVLKDKNALISLRQIIRELEGTQQAIWSPVILNGKGFGFVTNHSLVMASYISRANAALIDLERLLKQG